MFESIKQFERSAFDVKLSYLWVLHADKIPPHVGISVEGNYFSLKYNGKDEGVSVESVIELIEKKPIKTLAIQLKKVIVSDELKNAFARFERTSPNEVTCLAPIEKALGKTKFEKLELLLHDLELHNELEEIIGFNIDESYKGIPFYTEADIHKRLQFLENVNE